MLCKCQLFLLFVYLFSSAYISEVRVTSNRTNTEAVVTKSSRRTLANRKAGGYEIEPLGPNSNLSLLSTLVSETCKSHLQDRFSFSFSLISVLFISTGP